MPPVTRAALTAALLALTPAAAPADGVNLLVMGEDADLATVERRSPIFERVRDALAIELRARDIAVYDETAVTMEFYDLGRTRRPDAELISLARSVEIVPIDAVTAFEIYAATQPSPYEGVTDFRIRISGRVIDIASGAALGGYEVSYGPGDLPALPLNCDRACQIAFVGDYAAPIARELGEALAAQLAAAVDPAVAPPPPGAPACETGPAQRFTLSFAGFSAEDRARIDRFLAVFKGYVAHQPLGPDTLGYETCAEAATFAANLRGLFAQTGQEVWVEADGAVFSITHLAGPAAD